MKKMISAFLSLPLLLSCLVFHSTATSNDVAAASSSLKAASPADNPNVTKL